VAYDKLGGTSGNGTKGAIRFANGSVEDLKSKLIRINFVPLAHLFVALWRTEPYKSLLCPPHIQQPLHLSQPKQKLHVHTFFVNTTGNMSAPVDPNKEDYLDKGMHQRLYSK
jgi:hypothetical protein